MNATVDPALLNLVQEHVNTLKTDLKHWIFEVQEDRHQVAEALLCFSKCLELLEPRVERLEREQADMKQKQADMKQEQSRLSVKMNDLQKEHLNQGK